MLRWLQAGPGPQVQTAGEGEGCARCAGPRRLASSVYDAEPQCQFSQLRRGATLRCMEVFMGAETLEGHLARLALHRHLPNLSVRLQAAYSPSQPNGGHGSATHAVCCSYTAPAAADGCNKAAETIVQHAAAAWCERPAAATAPLPPLPKQHCCSPHCSRASGSPRRRSGRQGSGSSSGGSSGPAADAGQPALCSQHSLRARCGGTGALSRLAVHPGC